MTPREYLKNECGWSDEMFTDPSRNNLLFHMERFNRMNNNDWLRVGSKIKMQPFIDSQDWTFGEVKSIDEKWIYIKWRDIPEVLQHFHHEVKDFRPACH